MNEDQIRQIAQDIYDKNQSTNQWNVSKIPLHVHNGVDSNKVKYTDLLEVPLILSGVITTNGSGNIHIYDSRITVNSVIVVTPEYSISGFPASTYAAICGVGYGYIFTSPAAYQNTPFNYIIIV